MCLYRSPKVHFVIEKHEVSALFLSETERLVPFVLTSIISKGTSNTATSVVFK